VIPDTLPVDAGDVRLAAYVSGPRDAPPIVLVHGYPDSAAVWERVRAQLDSRYRVISYDVRGAGASEAPAARDGYRIERLAADLCAVVNAICGEQPFHLVGHDWGSIQSWEAVTDPQFKGRIRSARVPLTKNVGWRSNRHASAFVIAQILVHLLFSFAMAA